MLIVGRCNFKKKTLGGTFHFSLKQTTICMVIGIVTFQFGSIYINWMETHTSLW